MWYKALSDAGYSFGKEFQTQIAVESTAGERRNRSLVSLEEPNSAFPQSPYIMHPASIDGCFQTTGLAVWNGNRSAVNSVLVPAMIDECTVFAWSVQPKMGIGIASAETGRPGRPEDPTTYKSHAIVYDWETRQPLFQMQGFRYSALNTRRNIHDLHSYTRIEWKPDISFLTKSQFGEHISKTESDDQQIYIHSNNKTDAIIELMLHKKPALRVVELNLTGQPDSVWLDHFQLNPLLRGSCPEFCFSLSTEEALLDAQNKYKEMSEVRFLLFESNIPELESELKEPVDFMILKTSRAGDLIGLLDLAKRKLTDNGSLMIMSHEVDETHVVGLLQSVHLQNQLSYTLGLTSVVFATRPPPTTSAGYQTIHIAHFTHEHHSASTIANDLVSFGWCVEHHNLPFLNLQPGCTTLVLEDPSSELLSNMTEDNWEGINHLFSQEHKVLWVTVGSQMEVTNPNGALVQGLLRTVRAESPTLDLVSLDVESIAGSSALAPINRILQKLTYSSKGVQQAEAEYVERRGVLYISRVLPDSTLNRAEKDRTYGAETIMKPLHEMDTCVRLISKQPGSLDALGYVEICSEEIPLAEGFAEVDIHAASLNFKVGNSITPLCFNHSVANDRCRMWPLQWASCRPMSIS